MMPAPPSLAQQDTNEIFRLLTFQVGDGGPRLGATRGAGAQLNVDIHNALTYLYRVGDPQAATLPAIPIELRTLIEAGDEPLQDLRSLHETMTRLRASGSFTEPGAYRRVFYTP
jgi:hypothetical protein